MSQFLCLKMDLIAIITQRVFVEIYHFNIDLYFEDCCIWIYSKHYPSINILSQYATINQVHLYYFNKINMKRVKRKLWIIARYVIISLFCYNFICFIYFDLNLSPSLYLPHPASSLRWNFVFNLFQNKKTKQKLKQSKTTRKH